MRIINENKKTKLPVEFITSFVSTSWDKVGELKTILANIETEFSDAAELTKILQELLDSYLITIGQLESYLADKKQVITGLEDK